MTIDTAKNRKNRVFKRNFKVLGHFLSEFRIKLSILLYMSYKITNYTYKKAKLIGIKVFPSDNKKYKLDIFDLDGNYITSVGAYGYKDYPTYMNENGFEYAENSYHPFCKFSVEEHV